MLKYAALYLLAPLTLLLSSGLSFAGSIDVLVINSDRTVKKYMMAETNFTSPNIRILETIDLGDPWNTEHEVKKQIKNSPALYIYCIGSKAYAQAAKYANKEQKIFFSSAVAWRKIQEERPSYGVMTELPVENLLTMYRFFFPKIKTLGILYSENFTGSRLDEIRQNASDLEIIIVSAEVQRNADLLPALDAVLPRVDALWLLPDPLVVSGKKALLSIFQKADFNKKPVFAYNDVFASFGATLIVSPNASTISLQVLSLLEKVARDAKVTMPVEPPAATRITLNLKQAKKHNAEVRAVAIPTAQQVIR